MIRTVPLKPKKIVVIDKNRTVGPNLHIALSDNSVESIIIEPKIDAQGIRDALRSNQPDLILVDHKLESELKTHHDTDITTLAIVMGQLRRDGEGIPIPILRTVEDEQSMQFHTDEWISKERIGKDELTLGKILKKLRVLA